MKDEHVIDTGPSNPFPPEKDENVIFLARSLRPLGSLLMALVARYTASRAVP